MDKKAGYGPDGNSKKWETTYMSRVRATVK